MLWFNRREAAESRYATTSLRLFSAKRLPLIGSFMDRTDFDNILAALGEELNLRGKYKTLTAADNLWGIMEYKEIGQ